MVTAQELRSASASIRQQQTDISKATKDLQARQRRLTTARAVRQIPRERRQLEQRQISGVQAQLTRGTEQLTSTQKQIQSINKQLQQQLQQQTQAQNRLDKINRIIKRSFAKGSVGGEFSELSRSDRNLVIETIGRLENRNERNAIRNIESQLKFSLPASSRADVLKQIRLGKTQIDIPVIGVGKQTIDLGKRISGVAISPELKAFGAVIPKVKIEIPSGKIGAITKPSISKGIFSKLSEVGIRPDIPGALDIIEENIQTLTTFKPQKRIQRITTETIPPGTGGRGSLIKTTRLPNIEDVGTGVLPAFQEAELKAEDLFTKFKNREISEKDVEKGLAKIQKEFTDAEVTRQLPATAATTIALGALSVVAPPIGFAAGSFFGVQAFRKRAALKTFVKTNPKAAALQFGVGLVGSLVGAGGVSGLKFVGQKQRIAITEPKVTLIGGKSKEALIFTEQIAPKFKFRGITEDITGVKFYKVSVPTSRGLLEVTIREFERNGVKTFMGIETIEGVVRPVLIRGQAVVSGKEGLSQIITRVARIEEGGRGRAGVTLGRGSTTKFRVELRELIEKVNVERSVKFRENLQGKKLTTKEVSVLKSEVREPTVTEFGLVKLKSKVVEKIIAGKKLKPKDIPTGFQRDIVKKLVEKGVSPELAKRFATTRNFFSKAEIVNKLKKPFTKEQFEKAIKLNDSRFLFVRKLTDIEITGKTLGGNVKTLKVVARFFEKGVGIPKKKPVIKLDKGKKVEVPLLRKELAKKFKGTAPPKKPFQSLTKFKVKPLIKPVRPSQRVISPRERAIIELLKKKIPSPIGAFAEIAKASAKGIEKKAFISRTTQPTTKALLGVGLPRAVGGLGRDIGELPQFKFDRPRVTIEEEGFLSLSRAVSKGKPFPVSTKDLSDIKLDVAQGVIPLLANVPRLSLLEKNQIKQGEKLTTTQLTNLGLNSAERLRVRLATRLVQKQLQQQRQRQRRLQQQRRIIVRTPPKIPIKPKIPPTLLEDFGKKVIPLGTPPRGSKGYNAFVKQRKKFIKVNKVPLTKKKARDIASFVTDRSLSATWKIKKTNKNAKKPVKIIPPNYFERNIDKFRGFKKRKGTKIPLLNSGIEKRKFRLDSTSEVNKIQAARFSKTLPQRLRKVKPLIKFKKKK